MNPRLHVVNYHYVRDPEDGSSGIKGRRPDEFRRQVLALKDQYEMVTLQTALAFLAGRYQPTRDLCLLTFDDGLKDHFTNVTPILSELHVQGVFFAITGCADGRVAGVHKSHLLMAKLDFDEYRRSFLDAVLALEPETCVTPKSADVKRMYRWDATEVAHFKYVLNFHVSEAVRGRVLDELFARHVGDEAAVARELYFTWPEAREMQSAGMLIGGHTHSHRVLSMLDDRQQRIDLETCACVLRTQLKPQPVWPFSYPWGTSDSFHDETVRLVKESGFDCAFVTELGDNTVGDDLYALRRLDTRDVAC